MRKNFKPNNYLFPMPVLIIGTYDEDGNPDFMNAAWGTMEDQDVVLLELTSTHKTCKNMLSTRAFTVSFGDKKNVDACDYVGIASGNDVKDKVAHTGWKIEKAEKVNAPYPTDLPITLECELVRLDETDGDFAAYGKILNVSVKEDVLDEKGKLDLDKAELITFNSADNTYRILGDKVAFAFRTGLKLR